MSPRVGTRHAESVRHRARENTTLRFFDQRPASVAARWSFGIAAGVHGVAHQVRRHIPKSGDTAR